MIRLLYNILVSETPQSYAALIDEASRVVPRAAIDAEIKNLAFKYQIVREGDQFMVYKGDKRMGTTDEFVDSYAMTVEGKYGDAATAYAQKSFSVVRLAALPEWVRKYTPQNGDRLKNAA